MPISPRAPGSRPGGGSPTSPGLRRLGNNGLNGLVNVLFNTKFTDLCYGYNAFWAHCLPAFDLRQQQPAAGQRGPLWGDGFEIETLLTLRVVRAKLKVTEVPSFEHLRIHGQSNLNTYRDGMRVLRTIFREWPRRAARTDVDAASPLPRARHSDHTPRPQKKRARADQST